MIFVHPQNPVLALVCMAAGVVTAYGFVGLVLLLPVFRAKKAAAEA